ncbi:hypothetical protein [Lewinella sp. IMCC34191]|uniref:hypothetical protein n=1 Tax=Lewinella sp. IMCC34191 TaxID=2259172 RepID=UPI00130035D2|nr:hypothetical protein [Lewinella sp. IMCC34191]
MVCDFYRWYFYSLLVLAGSHLSAQTFVEQLATEVCNCLSAEALIYPRIQADRCVETVVNAHPRQIKAELKLSVRRDDDLKQLEALLIDPLAENCTVLRDLQPEREEPELRYTDIPLVRNSGTNAEKHPPADDRSSIAIEAPALYELRGKVTAYDGNRLELRAEDGRTVRLSVADRQLRRQLILTVGNQYTVSYRLDWRSDDKSVLRIVEDVN